MRKVIAVLALLLGFIMITRADTNFSVAPVLPVASAVPSAAASFNFRNASGAATSVKASAGNLYGFCLTNETAAVEYVEFFNTAAAPTLGTTAVVLAVKIPASATVCPGSATVAWGSFSTGIGFASVTAENGTTAASVTGALFYQ